jgi:anti-sigma B factor antagonist
VIARCPSSTITDSSERFWQQVEGWQESEAPTLVIRMQAYPDFTVVRLDGELDIASGEAFTRQLFELTDRGVTHLVADLTGLTFCDASGLGSLVRVRNRLVDRDGWLRLAGASPQMSRIIRLSGLSRTLPCFPAVTDALAAPEPTALTAR